MKILEFCPYYPPHIGGLESHADEFNKHLSRRGIAITVFAPRLPKNSPEIENKHHGVKIIRFPAFEMIPNYPLPKFWFWRFWRLFLSLFREKFEITISRTRFFNTSLLAFFYAKIKRIRWIHIEHGSDFVSLNSRAKTLIAKLYDHTFGFLIFKNSDINISISQAVRGFVKKFDKRDSPVIYRGIDIDEIEKVPPDHKFREKFENKIIIVWAGRLYKWKGVEKTIETIKKLPTEIKDKIIFLVIGDGEDKKRLQKMSDASIFFAGNVPRKEVMAILKIADIYVHSSESGGGLSTSLLEAIYCGCAIIATPHEGADEVIIHNENGLIAENSLERREALIELIKNNKKRADLANNSKNLIRNKFSWQKSIESYVKIFSQ